jgi:hypothetical protein
MPAARSDRRNSTATYRSTHSAIVTPARATVEATVVFVGDSFTLATA